MASFLFRWAIIITVLIAMPLVGVILSRQHFGVYLEFPPITRHIVPAPFNWWIFVIIAALDGIMLAAIAIRLIQARKNIISQPLKRTVYPFPIWGWVGGGIMLTGWWLAWTRYPWFAPFQHHTFCLPWVGYILLVNAWCMQRQGTSLLTENFYGFMLLFPTSSLFWWYFEFLNRMVQNWHYISVDHFGPIEYTLFASLAFATVLPAVLSTHRLLLSLPLFGRGLRWIAFDHPPPPWPLAPLTTLLVGAAGMALISRFPNYLYPFVWVAPLLVLTATQALWRQRSIATPLWHGDWRGLVTSAVAALICGFFWELWNHYSLARWAYSVPFVDRFHLFAMPVLGYGGYLPFGLECLAVARLVLKDDQLGMDDSG